MIWYFHVWLLVTDSLFAFALISPDLPCKLSFIKLPDPSIIIGYISLGSFQEHIGSYTLYFFEWYLRLFSTWTKVHSNLHRHLGYGGLSFPLILEPWCNSTTKFCDPLLKLLQGPFYLLTKSMLTFQTHSNLGTFVQAIFFSPIACPWFTPCFKILFLLQIIPFWDASGSTDILFMLSYWSMYCHVFGWEFRQFLEYCLSVFISLPYLPIGKTMDFLKD